jgi:hypothetical protein
LMVQGGFALVLQVCIYQVWIYFITSKIYVIIIACVNK